MCKDSSNQTEVLIAHQRWKKKKRLNSHWTSTKVIVWPTMFLIEESYISTKSGQKEFGEKMNY